MSFEEIAKEWNLSPKVGRVNDGWSALLEKALVDLDSLGCNSERIRRIKESNGRLRISIDPPENTGEECAGVLSEIQYLSSTICELCSEYKSEPKNPICLDCQNAGEAGKNYSQLQDKKKLQALKKLSQLNSDS